MQNFFLISDKFCFYWVAIFGIILGRYFLIAGGAYLVFYSLLSKVFAKRKLHRKPPLEMSMRRDIKLSILSAICFALLAAFILSEYELGATQLYASVDKYGLWYLGFSFVALLVLQDTYFYFMHRLFHHPFFFKWFHFGHHRSKEPTPWTSFAFDPLEAIAQGIFFVGIVFILPLHFIILVAALLVMTGWSVLTHLGFELFPPSFPCHYLGRWFIGSTHHSIHHRKYTVHYGLYFTLWDKLLNTHDPNYEREFDSPLRG